MGNLFVCCYKNNDEEIDQLINFEYPIYHDNIDNTNNHKKYYHKYSYGTY